MEVTVEVDLVCESCGTALNATQTRNGDIEVSPCDKCLKEAYEEGEKNDREN